MQGEGSITCQHGGCRRFAAGASAEPADKHQSSDAPSLLFGNASLIVLTNSPSGRFTRRYIRLDDSGQPLPLTSQRSGTERGWAEPRSPGCHTREHGIHPFSAPPVCDATMELSPPAAPNTPTLPRHHLSQYHRCHSTPPVDPFVRPRTGLVATAALSPHPPGSFSGQRRPAVQNGGSTAFGVNSRGCPGCLKARCLCRELALGPSH